MSSASSFTAEPGKRLWAGGFDGLAICVIFLVIAVAGELLGFDFGNWLLFGVLFFTYHFHCLVAREGRTLGKTAVDICVISAAGQKLSLISCALRAGVRAAPFIFLGLPGTVIPGVFFLLVLMLAEFHFLEHSPSRQTIADRIAQALVVNLPPLQPHRAPAGPMYSVNDAEFGFPPQRPREKDNNQPSRSSPALNLAPFSRWTLRDKAAQRRLALR